MKKEKYVLFQKNLSTNEWMEIGKYKSFEEIQKFLNLTYHTIQNIKLNRHKLLSKYFKILYNNEN